MSIKVKILMKQKIVNKTVEAQFLLLDVSQTCII